MSFRNVLVELKTGSVDWANITSDVLGRNPIQISRGKADETGTVSPSRCTLTLNNRLGRYSPRNPLSPLYGTIGRNTPLRVSLGQGAYGMVVSDSNGRAECNDSAALSFLGDLDLRVDLEVLAGNDWTTGNFDLASQFDSSDPARRWALILIGGKLRFQWWSNGTTGSLKQAETAVLPGPTTGRRILRVTLDVDNGAAGNTVTFYTGTTMAGPFTAIGAPIVQAGVTTLFNANSKLRIGSASSTTAYTHGHTDPAVFYSVELRNGIGGTVVASPNFAGQSLDPVPFAFSEFNDTQANTWAFVGTSDSARIWYGDVDVRFYGELSSLPPRWDVSGNDAYVSIEAAGLLRRLGQGTDPAQTGLREFITNGATTPAELPAPLTSYWPLSGGEGTTYSLNLGRAYNLSTRFYAIGGAVFTYGKDMGPYLGTGMELNATGVGTTISDPHMRGDVGTIDDNVALDFMWQSVSMGVLTARVYDYAAQSWEVTLNTAADAGTAQVKFTDDSGGVTTFPVTGIIPELQDTNPHHCRFQVMANGVDTDYFLYIDGVLVDSGTKLVNIYLGTGVIRFYYARYTPQTVMNMSHVTVWTHPTPAIIPTAAEVTAAAMGYLGETAGARMERVAGLGEIPLSFTGDPAATIVMGPQFSEAKLTQLRDAEQADLGVLGEQRDNLGLLYRTLTSMYNQTAVATLDYSALKLAFPFEPTDDDQYTRNDITTVRREGDSYRLTRTTGPLSVSEPPTGVGRYKDEVTVNVASDDQLPEVGGWLLNLGTLDEARYPSVAVDLHNPAVVADTALSAGLLAADFGDRLVVTNTDELNIYDDISLLILGYEETLSTFTHSLVFNCAPGSPFEVFTVEDTGSRISSGETSLTNASLTTTATSMSVLSADMLTLWTTAGGDMPISLMVGGEEMTVTAISGTTPGVAQTFTVTRSVNGVVKTHSSGEVVRLKRRAVWAL